MSSDAKKNRPSNKRLLKMLLMESQELGLSASERAVMMVIYAFTDLKGWAWPKQETIASLGAISSRTVRKALKKLEAVGIVHALKPNKDHKFGRIGSIEDKRKSTIKQGADLLLLWPIASFDARADVIHHRKDAVYVPNATAVSWFVCANDSLVLDNRGPFSLVEMGALAKHGKLPPTAMVYIEGDTTPRPASRIAEIAQHYPRLAA